MRELCMVDTENTIAKYDPEYNWVEYYTKQRKNPSNLAWHSGLIKAACVPEVFNCPELVQWCAKHCDADRRLGPVQFPGKKSYLLTSATFNAMLCLPRADSSYDPKIAKIYLEGYKGRCVLMNLWRKNPVKDPRSTAQKYDIGILSQSYMDLAWLMCKLWGLKNTSKFPREFIYVIHRLTEEDLITFDWGIIISDTVDHQLRKFKETQYFHAIAYLMAALCFWNDYPNFPRATQRPHEEHHIQFWYPVLRKENELEHFYTIQDKFVFPVKMFITGDTPDRLTQKAKEFLRCRADYFVDATRTWSRLYGSPVDPYLLPWFVCERFVLLEFARQLVPIHLIASDKVVPQFASIPFGFGRTSYTNGNYLLSAVKGLKDYKLGSIENLYHYDPDLIFQEYAHETGYDPDWAAETHEVAERMRNIDDCATAQRRRDNVPSPSPEEDEDGAHYDDNDEQEDAEGRKSTVEEEEEGTQEQSPQSALEFLPGFSSKTAIVPTSELAVSATDSDFSFGLRTAGHTMPEIACQQTKTCISKVPLVLYVMSNPEVVNVRGTQETSAVPSSVPLQEAASGKTSKSAAAPEGGAGSSSRADTVQPNTVSSPLLNISLSYRENDGGDEGDNPRRNKRRREHAVETVGSARKMKADTTYGASAQTITSSPNTESDPIQEKNEVIEINEGDDTEEAEREPEEWVLENLREQALEKALATLQDKKVGIRNIPGMMCDGNSKSNTDSTSKNNTPKGRGKLPLTVTEMKEVELNLNKMKASDVVYLGLATGLATKDKVIELETRVEALETENKALKTEHATYKDWYQEWLNPGSPLLMESTSAAPPPADLKEVTEEEERRKRNLATTTLKSIKQVITEDLQQRQELLLEAREAGKVLHSTNNKAVYVKQFIGKGKEDDNKFVLEALPPYVSYVFGIHEKERATRNLPFNFQLREIQGSWEKRLKVLGKAQIKLNELEMTRLSHMEALNEAVAQLSGPPVFRDGALVPEQEYKTAVDNVKKDFSEELKGREEVNPGNIREWLIQVAVQNDRLRTNMELLKAQSTQLEENYIRVQIKGRSTVGPHKDKILQTVAQLRKAQGTPQQLPPQQSPQKIPRAPSSSSHLSIK